MYLLPVAKKSELRPLQIREQMACLVLSCNGAHPLRLRKLTSLFLEVLMASRLFLF